jgi:hypothetical protein
MALREDIEKVILVLKDGKTETYKPNWISVVSKAPISKLGDLPRTKEYPTYMNIVIDTENKIEEENVDDR